ncbi:hypothetical protein [Sandaracinus amylolyticus]|uniref:hypothetical protein n=1 Tax=Sandaracinus amylolyticus TaxID=927083 RepID=UPI001F18D750|nr:hypothetical protein [Sandaracinus amylolyticus]
MRRGVQDELFGLVTAELSEGTLHSAVRPRGRVPFIAEHVRTPHRCASSPRRLVEMAHDFAPFFDRTCLERTLRERAPGLVRLVGEREVHAVIELATRPLRAS